MKTVKCNLCKRERKVEDNVIMAICNSCQVEMFEIKKLNEVENGEGIN